MKIGELCLCTHPSQKVAVKPKVQLVQCANIFGRTGIDGVCTVSQFGHPVAVLVMKIVSLCSITLTDLFDD